MEENKQTPQDKTVEPVLPGESAEAKTTSKRSKWPYIFLAGMFVSGGVLALLIAPVIASWTNGDSNSSARSISSQRATELIEQCKVDGVYKGSASSSPSISTVPEPGEKPYAKYYDVPADSYDELSKIHAKVVYIEEKCPRFDLRGDEGRANTVTESAALLLIQDCKVDELLERDPPVPLPTISLKAPIYRTASNGSQDIINSQFVRTVNYDLLKEKLAASRVNPQCQQQ